MRAASCSENPASGPTQHPCDAAVLVRLRSRLVVGALLPLASEIRERLAAVVHHLMGALDDAQDVGRHLHGVIASVSTTLLAQPVALSDVVDEELGVKGVHDLLALSKEEITGVTYVVEVLSVQRPRQVVKVGEVWREDSVARHHFLDLLGRQLGEVRHRHHLDLVSEECLTEMRVNADFSLPSSCR